MYFWAEKENFASMKRLEMIVCRCVLLLCSVALVSCNKDMFDEEEYIKLVEVAQPVSGIDASHDWDLTASYNMTVTIGSAYRDMSRLQILSENPASGRSATLLGDYLLSGNEREAVTFTAPRTMTKFYAALVDSEGRYTVAPFTSYDRSVDFSDSLVTNASAISTMTTQAYTYCFEDEMPQPGDYDYNDVVLRISQERTAKNQITLNVTLAAVGSLSQVAAAIRLVGYTYDQIESITTVDGVTFDEGYKKSSLPFIDSNELLVAGSDNAAVINVFEDAHWATGAVAYATEGYIPRYKYNVTKYTTEESDMVSPNTISFVITFKSSVQNLNSFTLNSLDPFVILEYNGIFMENHAVYKHRSVSVLHEYTQPLGAVILPWSLIVPSGAFRYPLDGVHIGYSKDGALFGAYMTLGHAFGQWASNKDTANDWYGYPTTNMVY